MFLEHGPTPIPAAPRLVNMGRLSEQKGQRLLIQAAAALRARGLDFELVIVGDGPMRGELERLIDQFDLRGRVRITGFLETRGSSGSSRPRGPWFCPASPRGCRWYSWRRWPWVAR